MKKIKYLLAPLCFLTLSTSAQALSPKPEHCPAVEQIQAQGMSQYEEIDAGYYTVFEINNYGTKEKWGFAMNAVQGNSGEEAVAKANEALKSLISDPMAEPMDYQGTWVCFYFNNYGYMSAAFTPVPDVDMLKRMKKIG